MTSSVPYVLTLVSASCVRLLIQWECLQTKTALHWVLLGPLSSDFVEPEFSLIQPKRQKARCRASVKILSPPDFRTKEFICTNFPWSILAGNGNLQYSPSKQTSPRPHTSSLAAQGCCPLFSPTTHKMPSLNKLQLEKESAVPGHQSLTV